METVRQNSTSSEFPGLLVDTKELFDIGGILPKGNFIIQTNKDVVVWEEQKEQERRVWNQKKP